jgi:hypothetical protein
MLRLVALLFVPLFSSYLLASDENEAINCTLWLSEKDIGRFSGYQLGEEIDFETLIKIHLQEQIRETNRVMNLEAKYRGPDEEYIPRLIELLGRKPTPASDQSKGFFGDGVICLWERYEPGDSLREFEFTEEYRHKKGYVIMREGRAIAYFYSSVAFL